MLIFKMFCMILNFICEKNPLNFDLVPSKRSMDGNLTLVIPISLTLLFNACVLLFMWSTISLNCFIVTTYKSFIFLFFIILMSLSHEVVAFDIIATSVLRGMAL